MSLQRLTALDALVTSKIRRKLRNLLRPWGPCPYHLPTRNPKPLDPLPEPLYPPHPTGHPSKNAMKLSEVANFDDWTVDIPGLGKLLCCPEDHRCAAHPEHPAQRTLCEDCEVPLCTDCLEHQAEDLVQRRGGLGVDFLLGVLLGLANGSYCLSRPLQGAGECTRS